MKNKRAVSSVVARLRPHPEVKKRTPKVSVRPRPVPKPMSGQDMRRRMGY